MGDLAAFEQLEALATQQLAAVRGGDMEGFERLSALRDQVANLLRGPVPVAARPRARALLASVQLLDAAIIETLQHDLAAASAERAALHHGSNALRGYAPLPTSSALTFSS